MISIDDKEIHVLPYRLWAVWQQADYSRKGGHVEGDVFIGQVIGFDPQGSYCVQGSNGLLMILDEDHFENGDLETFDTRTAAEARFKECEHLQTRIEQITEQRRRNA